MVRAAAGFGDNLFDFDDGEKHSYAFDFVRTSGTALLSISDGGGVFTSNRYGDPESTGGLAANEV